MPDFINEDLDWQNRDVPSESLLSTNSNRGGQPDRHPFGNYFVFYRKDGQADIVTTISVRSEDPTITEAICYIVISLICLVGGVEALSIVVDNVLHLFFGLMASLWGISLLKFLSR